MISLSFNIYYQNVQGLRTKSHDFFSQVLLNDYDIICVSESWLTPNFYDKEFFDNRYVLYRCDRTEESGAERGGGVMVAVRSEYQPLRRDWPCPSPADAECIWVSLPTHIDSNCKQQRYLHIACVYIPRGRGYKLALDNFFDIASKLVADYSNDVFLLTGDFNIYEAAWTKSD